METIKCRCKYQMANGVCSDLDEDKFNCDDADVRCGVLEQIETLEISWTKFIIYRDHLIPL